MPAQQESKFTLGRSKGRPAHYETAEELEKQVKSYFTWCKGKSHYEDQQQKVPGKRTFQTVKVKIWDREPENPTTTGLALYLGFASRQSLYDLQKHEDFSYIIKRAVLVIENKYETRLKDAAPAGAIFALSNMGWKNRHGVEVSDPEGNPLPPPVTEVNIGVDVTKLSTEALEEIVKARTKHVG